MADFTRTVIPSDSSWPKFPTGLDSWGLSGKGQFRGTMQVGRTWSEEYPPLKYDNPKLRAFLAYINKLWRERTIFTISHYDLRTPVGTISGSVTVNGASQTGSAITVSAITGTLKQGDVISIAGLNLVYDVTADVANGGTSIPISPPIYAGGSPANGAAITYTGVKFRAVITGLDMPDCKSKHIYKGLKITFRECP